MKPRIPVIWLTGLSGSGKSTIAKALATQLDSRNVRVAQLDGDALRQGLNSDLGFSDEDRLENVRRAAHVARILRNGGSVVICSLISPKAEMRYLAREIIGEGFVEVFVNCPIEICAQRDAKGLYAKAVAGEIPDMTGIGSDYEPPISPDIEVRTHEESLDECVSIIINALNRR
jgi:adenylylsulfate kinase